MTGYAILAYMADPRLFDPGPIQRPDRNYEPSEWAHAPDIVWHASPYREAPKPQEGRTSVASANPGLHTGTLDAAMHRSTAVRQKREYLHPYALSGQFALAQPKPNPHEAPGWQPPTEAVWRDEAANYSTAAEQPLREGQTVPYRNIAEDVGSVSFLTARPENLSTWSESTLADPNAPSHLRALAEHYELVGRRSESMPVGSARQQYLPGIPKAKKSAEMDDRETMFSAHPEGYIGHHDPYSSRVVHTLRRKGQDTRAREPRRAGGITAKLGAPQPAGGV